MKATVPASLRRDGQPLTRLHPGWLAGGRHHGPAGLEALILHHAQTGQEACWWLSPDGDILACHALALDEQISGQVLEAISPALQQVSTTLLSGEGPALTEADMPQDALAPLVGLPLLARLQLVGLWCRSSSASLLILPPAALLDRDEPDNGNESGTETPFSPSLIRSLLDTRLAGPHTLACSPFSGRTLRTELTMPTDKGVACRFSDEEDGQTFYLFWHIPAGQTVPTEGKTPFLYYPKGRLLAGDGPFTPLVPVFVLTWLISNPHCIEELKHARPFRLEDYGVGHASSLWDDVTPTTSRREEAGQMPSSFPFSSPFWGRSSFFRTSGSTDLPGKDHRASPPRKPQEHHPRGTGHDRTTGAGHDNHDEP